MITKCSINSLVLNFFGKGNAAKVLSSAKLPQAHISRLAWSEHGTATGMTRMLLGLYMNEESLMSSTGLD